MRTTAPLPNPDRAPVVRLTGQQREQILVRRAVEITARLRTLVNMLPVGGVTLRQVDVLEEELAALADQVTLHLLWDRER